MVTLQKIEIEWFGSIPKLEYKFEKPGINTIQGRNGSGKTTIYNALCWVLYRQTIKKNCTIEPWPHVIDSTYNGTKVELTFKDGYHNYKIIRCKNYKGKVLGKKGASRLIILQDNQEVVIKRDISDGQSWINEKIQYSFELFKNTVMFGQLVTRLTEESGPEKKRVFEEAFETTFIKKAKEKQEESQANLKSEIERLTIEKMGKTQVYAELLKSYITNKKIRKTFKKNLNKSLRDCKLALNKNQSKFDELKKLNIQMLKPVDTSELVSKEFRATLDKNNQERWIEEYKESIERIKKKAVSKDLVTCPKCKESFYLNKAALSREELAVELKGLKDKIGEANEKVKKYERQRLKYLGKISEAKKLNSRIEASNKKRAEGIKKRNEVEESIRDCENMLKYLKTQKPPDVNLVEIKKDKDKAFKELATISKKLADCERKKKIIDWLLKGPLSNSGLKAYIFDGMLKKLNYCTKAYANQIGFIIKVYVDMSSSSKNINTLVLRGGEEVPYEDLSGGQKQLINVTLALALHDTVCLDKPINCLLMDELFESLDKENIEVVTELISQKAKNKSIHLVTHQNDFNPLNKRGILLKLSKKGQTVLA